MARFEIRRQTIVEVIPPKTVIRRLKQKHLAVVVWNNDSKLYIVSQSITADLFRTVCDECAVVAQLWSKSEAQAYLKGRARSAQIKLKTVRIENPKAFPHLTTSERAECVATIAKAREYKGAISMPIAREYERAIALMNLKVRG